MAVLKDGVRIHCEECRCIAAADRVFEMQVPVSLDSGGTGIALLRCDLRNERHDVRLKSWRGPSAGQAASRDMQRIMAVLDVIGRKNVCGSAKVCPEAIARRIEAAACSAGTLPRI
jgi:hypothetical protein